MNLLTHFSGFRLARFLIHNLALGNPFGDARVALPLLVLCLPDGGVLGPAPHPLCPSTRTEPKITLEELTRLYREEEEEELEQARRRGRGGFGIWSRTLKEADKDSGIGSLQ